MLVRPFLDSDREAMTEVYSAAWHQTYDRIDGAAAIDRVIFALMGGEPPEMFTMQPSDVALVAVRGGRLIGGIRGHPRAGMVHLSGMYVATDAHRSGVGHALLARLSTFWPSDTIVRADVRPTSVAARRFYARQGFREIGRGRAHVGADHWVDMIELRRDPMSG